MKKSISFVGSVGIPARYGGFETLVENLGLKLTQNYTINVFCTTKAYKKTERQRNWNTITRYFIPFNANGVQSIIYDLISLIIAIKNSEIIVVLGGSAGLFLPWITLIARKKKIVFHPDGKEWSRNKWKILSKLYLYLSIQTGCIAAHNIIIDNKALEPVYKKFKKKLVYCAYGGDQYSQTLGNCPHEDFWLTIARAEPENYLQEIAETFKKSKQQKWILISNYNQTKFGKQLFKKFNNYDNITFMPSNYSSELINRYLSKCKGYIHGHTMGGTNPTLTVAMWLNKPLICHNNNFNKSTTHNKALFFNTKSDLEYLIEQNYTFNKNLHKEALTIAMENYTWKKVANTYANLFESLTIPFQQKT